VKRRIVLLGPPASGKGTQAKFIQKRFGISATSTGAILRAEAKRGTAVGMTAAGIISKGSLAPDELVLQLVAAWLKKIDQSGTARARGERAISNCGGKLEVRNDAITSESWRAG
jgi:adenylate kinase family enzyme